MEPRGGSVSCSLNVKIWNALAKYVADNPGESRGGFIRAALVTALQKAGYLEKSE